MDINSREGLRSLSKNLRDSLHKKIESFLESEILRICELYDISPHKLELFYYPDGLTKIALVLSELQLKSHLENDK